jgi:hypothetical protein
MTALVLTPLATPIERSTGRRRRRTTSPGSTTWHRPVAARLRSVSPANRNRRPDHGPLRRGVDPAHARRSHLQEPAATDAPRFAVLLHHVSVRRVPTHPRGPRRRQRRGFGAGRRRRPGRCSSGWARRWIDDRLLYFAAVRASRGPRIIPDRPLTWEMEPTGRLELPTARLQVGCAASCATPACGPCDGTPAHRDRRIHAR